MNFKFKILYRISYSSFDQDFYLCSKLRKIIILSKFTKFNIYSKLADRYRNSVKKLPISKI